MISRAVRTAAEERSRWDAEWGREGEAAIWGCPGMTWAEGVARDVAMIAPHLGLTHGRPQVVLDLGCGPGRVAVALAKSWRAYPGWRVVGVDISERVIRAARAAKTDAGITNGAVFHMGDGRTLPDAVVSIDAAWSMLLFQHLEAGTVRGYLWEVARVLRPGGRFRFQWTVGATDSPYAHDHDPLDIVEWCDDVGLLIEECPEPDPDWPTWAWGTATRCL